MKKLVAYFIDNSFIVNLLSVLMLLLGANSLIHMKRDLISSWSTKQIEISATLIGATPSAIEKTATYPIEQTIKNLAGIEKITSTSSFGFMSISITVKDEYKQMNELEQKIKDAINNIKSTLPQDIDDINVAQLKMTESWFSSYAITGFDQEDVKHQRWLYKLKEKINQTSGIARISDTSNKKNIYIKISPSKLSQYQISLREIYTAVQNSFTLYPIGKIEKGTEDIFIEMKNDEIAIEDINNIILRVRDTQRPLRLADISVVDAHFEKVTEIHYTNAKEAIFLTLFKDLETDTISLKEHIEKVFTDFSKEAPKGIEVLLTGDGPSFIERQINALKSNALFGVILVVLTLMFFLGFKTSLMTSFGLPLSYMFTFFVLEKLGIKIDLISIVGMLLVLGILVDDAIVVSEQYTQNLEQGMPPKEAAIAAVDRTWLPICGAILTTIIAFLPLLLSDDGLSDVMMAIPVVVISSLGISLIESLFILPNHLVHFVKKPAHHEPNKLLEKTTKGYTSLLKVVLRYRYLTVISFVGLFIFSLYFASKHIPTNFNLNISSEKVKVTTILKDSKNLEDSRLQLQEIWDKLSDLDKNRFQYLAMSIGSIWDGGEEKNGPQYASFTVRFSQLDDHVENNKKYVMDTLEKKILEIKESKLGERLARIDAKVNFDGYDNDKSNIVEVKISSTNPFNAQEISQRIKEKVSPLKNIVSIELDDSNFSKSWTYTPDKSEILAHGLSMSDIALQIKSYIAKTMIHENLATDIPLKIYAYSAEENAKDDTSNETLEDLNNKVIILPNGQTTKTKKLGVWTEIKKEKSINHEALKRIIVVNITINTEKTSKEITVKDIESNLQSLEEEFNQVTITTLDADEQAQKNKSSMIKNVFLGIGLIYFVLAVILRSTISPFIICSAIPFGLIGVIWAFYFQGLKIDIMAIIGIIAMAGVVVNDSLLLVDTANQNKDDQVGDKEIINLANIIKTCVSRLRPILLTSITTLGGVFPMAYGIGGDSGFTKPLAMSMGWGLLFSTGLTLLLIPSLVLIQSDFSNFIKFRIFKKQKLSYDNIKTNEISAEEIDGFTNMNIDKDQRNQNDQTIIQ